MKKIYELLMALAVGGLLTACAGNDDEVTAYDGEEPVLGAHHLPQGSHDYDQTILEWHRRFDVLPLYRFDEKDWYWSVTSDIRMSYDPVTDRDNGGYLIVPAEEACVGQQLELIERQVLRYVPDETLARILPMKLLLASDIQHCPATLKGRVPESSYEHLNVYGGFDYIAFSGGTTHISEMTDAELKKYKVDGLQLLINYAIDNGRIPVPEAFSSVSDYSVSYNSATTAYRAGLLSQYGASAAYDLKQYVKLLLTTPQITIMTQYLSSYPLIKQKYDVVENYFKETYGMDLQAVGNGN